jgi:hypothetical protein
MGLFIATVQPDKLTPHTHRCLSERLAGLPHVIQHFEHRAPDIHLTFNRTLAAYRAFDARPVELPYLFACGGDVWWQQGQVSQAISILEENEKLLGVTGILQVPMATEYLPPYLTTERGTLAPMSHEVGELIPLRSFCLGWTFMRTALLDRLEADPFKSEAQVFAKLRSLGEVVTERTLQIGRIVDGAAYYPHRPRVPLEPLGDPLATT